MRHKLTKKVLSLLVTLAMLLSMVPMAYAEETTTVLTGFDELAKTEYIVETGTEQDALGLPDTLNATKQVVTQETTTNEKGEKVTSTVYTTEPVTVENVTWSGDYDANTAGTYTLTASAEGYESSVWPTVAVTLSDPEENVALAIGVTDIWDGSIATGFAGGMGTQEDPYLIATGAQLAFLAKQVYEGTLYSGNYFKLIADIDLNNQEWLPIGSKNESGSTKTFSGYFDGDEHTISNLKITVLTSEGTAGSYSKRQFGHGEYTSGDNKIGLFGYVQYGNSVTNLKICNANINGTALEVNSNASGGGAAAVAIGNNKSANDPIKNIHVTGTIRLNGYVFVGGIVGYAATETKFNNCSLNGDIQISGWMDVGGICGYQGAKFTDCQVIGAAGSFIEARSHGNDHTGGLSGKSGFGSGGITAGDCTVAIDLNGNGDCVGGMAGMINNAVSALTNCSYTGTISAAQSPLYTPVSSEYRNLGAMVGTIESSTANLSVTNCSFNGKLLTQDKEHNTLTFDTTTGTSARFLNGGMVGGKKDDGMDIANFAACVVNKQGQMTLYQSMEAAIAAANSGDTITLLSDVEVSDIIAITKSLTLDLNGNTVINKVAEERMFHVNAADVSFTIDGKISGSAMQIPADSTSWGFVKINNESATLLVDGGTYTGETNRGSFFKVGATDANVTLKNVTVETDTYVFDTATVDTVKVNVEGGSYTTTKEVENGTEMYCVFGIDTYDLTTLCTFTGVKITSAGGACIEATGGTSTFTACDFNITRTSDPSFVAAAVAVSWEGTANIISGSYTSAGYGVYVYTSGGTINVEDGIITGGMDAVCAGLGGYDDVCSTVNIKGGDFTGTLNAYGTNNLGPATISVTGGTFTSDPSTYVKNNGTDYIVKRNGSEGSYTYTVLERNNLISGVYLTNPSGALASRYYVSSTANGVWSVSYNPPSSSSSSGSSTTPSNPTTSTETKPDGSTTTTETKPDGTVTESNTSKPVTGSDGSTSQTTTETTTGKDGVTESKTETVTKPDGSASSTTESTTTKPDGTTTESKTETTINADGSTASTTTETTTNKDGTVTESKTEATTSTVTNKDGSTTETKQETTTTSTGSKTESTTVTTVNKDGSSTATTTATTTDKAGTVTESKTESTTSKTGTTTEKTTTTETKPNGTVIESTTGTTTKANGSSNSSTTSTTTKADGTTTTSTTTATTSLSTNKSTGTVTETKKETTTTSDGVKSEGTTVTQIQKDGTVTSTETVKASDSTGTTATKTTTLDAKGEVTTTAEAAVSAKAVTEAAKTGEAVTIPVEVTATKSTSTAPTVAVSVPKTAESVKVELPVQNVTSGTVAVIVHADGTEEIVKTSIPTEDGVALTVEGDVTVKVIDNSKIFKDVHPVDHWAQESIDFVSSRELFTGKTVDTFAPQDPTTRAQLMTVLARMDGADTSEKPLQQGMNWAVESGVSDGSNPNNTITRQQLAAMLYRYAGSPETNFELTQPDAGKVSDYAVDAMRWAVENGIIKGKTDGTLDPYGLATRAQVAAMMARYCNQAA